MHADELVGRAVGGLSRLRGRRLLHPRGTVVTAVLDLPAASRPTAAPLLDTGGARPAVVRLSRGAGLRDGLPDVQGLALRVTDAGGPGRHQDLLLDSCLPPPWHRLLAVRLGVRGWYSTLLAHRIGDTPCLVLAHLTGPVGPGRLVVVDRRARVLAQGTITLGAPLPLEDTRPVRFDPGNAGGGIEPPRLLTAARHASYRAAQDVERQRSRE